LQILVAEADELKIAGLALQFDGFDGAGADVDAD
jgi:hypothetical protein